MATYNYISGTTYSSIADTNSADIWNFAGLSTGRITVSANQILNDGGDDNLNAAYTDFRTLTLGGGNDTADINNVTITGSLNTGNGDDTITINNTTISTNINAGRDDDTITLENSTVGNVLGGNGNNTLNMDNSTASSVSMGSANTIQDVTITNSSITGDFATVGDGSIINISDTFLGDGAGNDKVSLGTENTTVNLTRVTFDGQHIIAGSGGNNNITISDSSIDGFLGGSSGIDTFTITSTTFTESIGYDTLAAGSGDDVYNLTNIQFTNSADSTVYSGSDADTFNVYDFTAGDFTVDGGDDNDTLHVASNATIIYNSVGSEDGRVEYTDENNTVHTLYFRDIENVVADLAPMPVAVTCFVRGSNILTQNGERPIEDLKVGDLVKTMDRGLQTIRWIGKTTVSARGKHAPILITQGALGNARDLLVSPQHCMLIANWRTEVLFNKSEVLVPAKHLVNGDTIYQQEDDEVEYLHVMFDNHEIIYSEGIPSESYLVGEYALSGFQKETRNEILELFPNLTDDNGFKPAVARMVLTQAEAYVALLN